MSIFQEQHHDQLLLSYLSIIDIKVLSLINKYYCNLTKHILQPFREFFAIKDSLEILLHETNNYRDIYIMVNKKLIKIVHLQPSNVYLFTQAIMFGNYNVAKYVYDKYKPDMKSPIHYPFGYDINTYEAHGLFLHPSPILMLICIQKKTDFELVKFVTDLYKKYPSGMWKYLNGEYLTSDYGNEFDKVRKYLWSRSVITN